MEKHVYIKTRTPKATMAPTKIALSFSAIKARETDGEQLKGNRGKALRPLKVSKFEKAEEMILNWQQTRR